MTVLVAPGESVMSAPPFNDTLVTIGSYCLRASDNGTNLDSYTKVAEMRLKYDPIVTNVSLNGGADITLLPGATSTVIATGTVTDLNGYADDTGATSTIYRSGVGPACSADNNNCYRMGTSSCVFSSCSGYSCTVSCTSNIYYFADPTDIGTYAAENWKAFISVVDTAGGYGTSTTASPVELLTLRALNVTQGIDYGAVAVSSDTGAVDASTTVQNIGNQIINLNIAGTDLTNGASSTIPVANQKFATTTFTYSSCVGCNTLATTTVPLTINLSKPTTTIAVTSKVYWGIAIPFGVAGTAHQGVNTFYAVP